MSQLVNDPDEFKSNDFSSKKKILITSALPYVNNSPHLGNIIGSVLSADIYARFARKRHAEVIYICGTDDFGTATEIVAKKYGTTCEQIVTENRNKIIKVFEWFNLQFDYFGGTSQKCTDSKILSFEKARFDQKNNQRDSNANQTDKSNSRKVHNEDENLIKHDFPGCEKTAISEKKSVNTNNSLHARVVQTIYNKIKEKRITSDKMNQFYCRNCNMFLSDRYLTGTCKKCKNFGVQGDQCDSCGLLLNNEDIADPECVICKKEPFLKETEHNFLNLQDYKQFVENLYEKYKDGWSKNARDITLTWLHKDLHNRCITRDLKWGISVPNTIKVFYVWFDAVIGYISFFFAYQIQRRQLEESFRFNCKLNDQRNQENIKVDTGKRKIQTGTDHFTKSDLDEIRSSEEPHNSYLKGTDSLKNISDTQISTNSPDVTQTYKDAMADTPKDTPTHQNTADSDKNFTAIDPNRTNTLVTEDNSRDQTNNNPSYITETQQGTQIFNWNNYEHLKSLFDSYELVQFMGKDNVPFHTVIFPIISDSIAKRLSVTEYLLFENKKFSKSKKIGIFGSDLLNDAYGSADLWRYYLCKIRPETKDSNFSVDDFLSSVNELQNNFGNLCNRVLKYIAKLNNFTVKYRHNVRENELLTYSNKNSTIHKDQNCNYIFKNESTTISNLNLDEKNILNTSDVNKNPNVRFINEINGYLKEYYNEMEQINLKKGLKILSDLAQCCNIFLQTSFLTKKEKKEKLNLFSIVFSAIVLLSELYDPFIPKTCQKLKKLCNIEQVALTDQMQIICDHKISEHIEVLFSPLDPQIIDNLENMRN